MTLTVEAFAPSGTTTNGDGYEIDVFGSQGTHAAKVQAPSSQGGDTSTRSVRVGEVERPVLTAGLHIPLSADVPVAGNQRGIGWEYQVTAVGPNDDPALMGRRYLVVEVPAKSFATCRRLDVIEVPIPEEA